jgi:two-component system sensor histidine kinase KdpD
MANDDARSADPPSGEPEAGWLSQVARELRGRVASAAAAVEGLRDPAVPWTEEQRRELLGVAHGSLAEVALLLRELAAVGAQTGTPQRPPLHGTPVRELVTGAMTELGLGVHRPHTRLPASLPPVHGDPTLLRLVLASLLRHVARSTDAPPDIRAVRRDDRVLLRIGDRPPDDRRWVLAVGLPAGPPAWDRDTTLGPDLTVARGLARLLGGALRAGDARRRDGAVVLELPAAPDSG